MTVLLLYAVAYRGEGAVWQMAPGIHQKSLWRWSSSSNISSEKQLWVARWETYNQGVHRSWPRASRRLCTPLCLWTLISQTALTSTHQQSSHHNGKQTSPLTNRSTHTHTHTATRAIENNPWRNIITSLLKPGSDFFLSSQSSASSLFSDLNSRFPYIYPVWANSLEAHTLRGRGAVKGHPFVANR